MILGPSGCGKTSLLRCIAGLETPDSVDIRIGGARVDALPPERRSFGYVFQDLALFDHLSGRGNLDFGLRLRRWDREAMEQRVAELALRLDIGGLLGRRPVAMSGGERQRLAFARAIAFRPEVLLLDEPLSSLDAALRRELRAFIGEALRKEGTTALHVTHDVEEALELADLVFLMRNGRILARGEPRRLYEEPEGAWTVRALGLGSLLPLSGLKREEGGWRIRCALGELHIGDAAAALSGRNPDPSGILVFAPAGALAPAGADGGPPSDGQGPKWGPLGLARARVERAVYAGESYKITARLLGDGRAGGRGETDREAISVEFRTDPRTKLEPGEIVSLRADEAACRLVLDDL